MSSPHVENRQWSCRRIGCVYLLLISAVPIGFFVYLAIRYGFYHDADILEENLERLRSGKSTSLSLICTRDTDWIVEQVRGMPEIESVFMEAEHITIAGMRHL